MTCENLLNMVYVLLCLDIMSLDTDLLEFLHIMKLKDIPIMDKNKIFKKCLMIRL